MRYTKGRGSLRYRMPFPQYKGHVFVNGFRDPEISVS